MTNPIENASPDLAERDLASLSRASRDALAAYQATEYRKASNEWCSASCRASRLVERATAAQRRAGKLWARLQELGATRPEEVKARDAFLAAANAEDALRKALGKEVAA